MFEGNGRYNIYLNTKGKKDDISFDLKEMFKYINGGTDTIGMKTKSKLVKTIDKYVQEFNSNDTWRQGAMTIDMLIRENYDQGKDEGYKDGFAQGVSQSLAEGISQGISQDISQGISQGLAEGKARDLKEGKAEGLKEGKVEGLKEGKAQTQIQIVKNMHSMGLPLEKITKCTGLSTDEVNKILSEK